MNKALGVLLIVLWLVGLAWGGLTYTTREKLVDIGPIHATHEKTHRYLPSPVHLRSLVESFSSQWGERNDFLVLLLVRSSKERKIGRQC